MVLDYARNLRALLQKSRGVASSARQEAEDARLKSSQQAEALEAADKKIRELEQRNAQLLDEQGAMMFKYRRCRAVDSSVALSEPRDLWISQL
jgi:hypothetical protein